MPPKPSAGPTRTPCHSNPVGPRDHISPRPRPLKVRKITFAGQAARAATATGVNNGVPFRIEMRLLFKSPRMYQLQITTPATHPDADAKGLWDSFALTSS